MISTIERSPLFVHFPFPFPLLLVGFIFFILFNTYNNDKLRFATIRTNKHHTLFIPLREAFLALYSLCLYLSLVANSMYCNRIPRIYLSTPYFVNPHPYINLVIPTLLLTTPTPVLLSQCTGCYCTLCFIYWIGKREQKLFRLHLPQQAAIAHLTRWSLGEEGGRDGHPGRSVGNISVGNGLTVLVGHHHHLRHLIH